MKAIFKLITFLILSGSLIFNVFAINPPTDVKVISYDNTSVTISWSEVESAYMYLVNYGLNSGINGEYANQSPLIETFNGTYTITNLDEGKTYYFSVVAFDEDGNESTSSNEVIADTVLNNDINNFALNGVKIISSNKIELSFSLPLDNSETATRNFKIINKDDPLSYIEIVENKLNSEDNSKITLTLNEKIIVGNEYEVIVQSITSIDGKNIESGIDSTDIFILTEEIVEEEEPINLNSADDDITSTNSPTGKLVDASSIEKTTLNQASNTSTLPKTGPENIFLFLLAIILGFLVFMFKSKKS